MESDLRSILAILDGQIEDKERGSET